MTQKNCQKSKQLQVQAHPSSPTSYWKRVLCLECSNSSDWQHGQQARAACTLLRHHSARNDSKPVCFRSLVYTSKSLCTLIIEQQGQNHPQLECTLGKPATSNTEGTLLGSSELPCQTGPCTQRHGYLPYANGHRSAASARQHPAPPTVKRQHAQHGGL
eukprot:scaffold2783_cov20-Tisochrysis_lutea.AAC.3